VKQEGLEGCEVQEFEPHQQASVLALAKMCTPTEEATTVFGHPEPGVPQVAAFMDTVEPCLCSVYSATVLAAIDALLCWARATSNEFWYSPLSPPLFSSRCHCCAHDLHAFPCERYDDHLADTHEVGIGD
jgi:hypothetical protein